MKERALQKDVLDSKKKLRDKIIASVKRVVIKIGSNVLSSSSKDVDISTIGDIVEGVKFLRDRQISVLLVSSGAVSCGRKRINFYKTNMSVPEKQALAAIGQIRLMQIYTQLFEKRGIITSQILITQEAFKNRKQYLNLRNTITKLIEFGAIPIINENDSVATEELIIGDNDIISGLIASKIDADLLLILTNVEGVYKENSREVYRYLEVKDCEIQKKISRKRSSEGSGGMYTKVHVAFSVAQQGISVIIAKGKNNPKVIQRIFEGEDEGTFFLGKNKKLPARKKWIIARGTWAKGGVVIDKGAEEAIMKKGKSLLVAGIKIVLFPFNRGDSIKVLNIEGEEIGYGLANYSDKEIDKIKGMSKKEIQKIFGNNYYEEFIHRDNMVIVKDE